MSTYLNRVRDDYDYNYDAERSEPIPFRWYEDIRVGFKDQNTAVMHSGMCRAAVRYDFDAGLIEIFTPHSTRTLCMEDVLYVEQILPCDLGREKEGGEEGEEGEEPKAISLFDFLTDWARSIRENPR